MAVKSNSPRRRKKRKRKRRKRRKKRKRTNLRSLKLTHLLLKNRRKSKKR